MIAGPCHNRILSVDNGDVKQRHSEIAAMVPAAGLESARLFR
jgi:hypothetical protein